MKVLVPALDLPDIVNDALALGAECGDDQSHSRPDVGAGKILTLEASRADDNGAVGVAQNDLCAH